MNTVFMSEKYLSGANAFPLTVLPGHAQPRNVFATEKSPPLIASEHLEGRQQRLP